MGYWSDFASYIEGSKISDVIDISGANLAESTSISWTEYKPTGTRVLMYTRLSVDGGTVYTGWTACTNGGSIPGITNKVTDLSNARIQFKVMMDNLSDYTKIPKISNIGITINATTYPISGNWYTPALDVSNYAVGQASAVWDIDVYPVGTIASVYTRTSSDGVVWGAWANVASSGGTYDVSDSYVQAKVVLTSNPAREASPSLASLSLGISNITIGGQWRTPTMDLANARNLDYTEVLTSASMQSGDSLTVQTRSSEDGITFGKWYNLLPSNVPQHEPERYVQARMLWSGASSEVDYMKVSYDDPNFIGTIAEGLSKDYEWSFVTFNDNVYACNGVDGLFKYDGTTWSEVSTGLGVVPAILEVHQERLWMCGYRDSRLYFSDEYDGDTWQGDYKDINRLDGDYITGILSFGNYLIASKVRSKTLITGDGVLLNDGTINYQRQYLETPTGAMGNKNLIKTDTSLAFLSYEGMKISDLVRDTTLSNKLVDSFEELTKSRLEFVAMAYWNDLILVSVPSNSGYNSAVWAYNMLTDAWSVYPDWNIGHFVRFNIRGEEILYGADSTKGQIYEMFTGSLDVDVPIEYDYQSKDYTFGYPERFKLFKNFYVEYEKMGASINNEIIFYVDDVEVATVVVPVPYGNDGDTYVTRLIPPSKNVILGYRVAWRFKGISPVKQAKLEFEVRSAIPPTLNLL